MWSSEQASTSTDLNEFFLPDYQNKRSAFDERFDMLTVLSIADGNNRSHAHLTRLTNRKAMSVRRTQVPPQPLLPSVNINLDSLEPILPSWSNKEKAKNDCVIKEHLDVYPCALSPTEEMKEMKMQRISPESDSQLSNILKYGSIDGRIETEGWIELPGTAKSVKKRRQQKESSIFATASIDPNSSRSSSLPIDDDMISTSSARFSHDASPMPKRRKIVMSEIKEEVVEPNEEEQYEQSSSSYHSPVKKSRSSFSEENFRRQLQMNRFMEDLRSTYASIPFIVLADFHEKVMQSVNSLIPPIEAAQKQPDQSVDDIAEPEEYGSSHSQEPADNDHVNAEYDYDDVITAHEEDEEVDHEDENILQHDNNASIEEDIDVVTVNDSFTLPLEQQQQQDDQDEQVQMEQQPVVGSYNHPSTSNHGHKTDDYDALTSSDDDDDDVRDRRLRRVDDDDSDEEDEEDYDEQGAFSDDVMERTVEAELLSGDDSFTTEDPSCCPLRRWDQRPSTSSILSDDKDLYADDFVFDPTRQTPSPAPSFSIPN